MAALVRSNTIEIKRTGVQAEVPDNDVARLMYYLSCVCTAINCSNDPDIKRFIDFENYRKLSADEQKALLVVCYTFSPDVFHNKVFFQNDELCGNYANDFFEISQIQNQVVAVESIVIAGQNRQVNKIMTYKMQWMQRNYIGPMQRLASRLNTPARPTSTSQPISYRPYTTSTPSNNRPMYTGVKSFIHI